MRRFFGRLSIGESSRSSSGPSSNNGHGEPFKSQGDALALRGDYAGAIKLYKQALGHAPKNVSILLARSIAYGKLSPPENELALSDAMDACDIDIESCEAHAQKGKIYIQKGNLEDAALAIAEAVRLSSTAKRDQLQKLLWSVTSQTVAIEDGDPEIAARIQCIVTGADQEEELPRYDQAIDAPDTELDLAGPPPSYFQGGEAEEPKTEEKGKQVVRGLEVSTKSEFPYLSSLHQ